MILGFRAILAALLIVVALVGGCASRDASARQESIGASGVRLTNIDESGSTESAVPDLPHAVSDDPDLFKRGHAAYSSSDYSSAIAKLKDAIEKDPNNPKVAEARYMIAKCYDDLNKTSEAVTAFKEYLKLHASDPAEKERAQQARKRVGLLSGTGTFDN